MEKLYKPNEVAKILNVTVKTIQNWDKEGKIKVERSPSNRRMIPQSEVDRLLNKEDKKKEATTVVIYARVASYRQKEELDKQVGYLVSQVDTKKNMLRVITDIDSGVNDKRQGILELNKLVESKVVSQVYVTHKDILASFGYHYLEMYYSSYGTEIKVLKEEEQKIEKDEWAEEFLEVCARFLGRLRKEDSQDVKKKMEEIIKETAKSL